MITSYRSFGRFQNLNFKVYFKFSSKSNVTKRKVERGLIDFTRKQ